MAFGQQRARLCDLTRAAGRDQNPREPRVERHVAHLFAERREANHVAAGCGLRIAAAAVHKPETFQQRKRCRDRVLVRPLEPFEGARIAAPRDHVEDGARQIDAVKLRLAMRAQPVTRVPQAAHDARPQAAGAAGPLIRGVRGDAFRLEAVDAPVGVVPRHLVQPRVDDGRHAGNGQRRLRDIGGHDHAAPRGRPEREVLRVGVERPVQRDDLDRAADLLLDLGHRAANLGCPRQEAQHLTVGRGQHVGSRLGHRALGGVGHVERMRAARHIDHRATVEKRGNGGRLERRRHHHNPQIGPRPPRLPRQRDCQVRVHTALVKLVEHDGREVGEQRVGLQAGGQDPLGDDEEARLRAESALEAHLPADLAAKGPAALVGDARRNRTRGDASGL